MYFKFYFIIDKAIRNREIHMYNCEFSVRSAYKKLEVVIDFIHIHKIQVFS
jgi:hypothetical protein